MKGLPRRVDALESYPLIAMMTLLILVRYYQGAWQYSVLFPAFLGVAALFPRVIYKEQFWFALTVVLGVSVIQNWYYHGNHTYLLLYWCVALLLSCFATDRKQMLAASARWLIGSMFLFAFIWKLLSPEFSSGASMRYFMLATIPMGVTTGALTGLNVHDLQYNIQLVETLMNQPQAKSMSLIAPATLGRWADVLTIATQVIEGVLAVVFLSPLPQRWVLIREAALIGFFLSAYSVLPVPSFAALLACMGLALAQLNGSKLFFIAAFFAYPLIELIFHRP